MIKKKTLGIFGLVCGIIATAATIGIIVSGNAKAKAADPNTYYGDISLSVHEQLLKNGKGYLELEPASISTYENYPSSYFRWLKYQATTHHYLDLFVVARADQINVSGFLDQSLNGVDLVNIETQIVSNALAEPTYTAIGNDAQKNLPEAKTAFEAFSNSYYSDFNALLSKLGSTSNFYEVINDEYVSAKNYDTNSFKAITEAEKPLTAFIVLLVLDVVAFLATIVALAINRAIKNHQDDQIRLQQLEKRQKAEELERHNRLRQAHANILALAQSPSVKFDVRVRSLSHWTFMVDTKNKHLFMQPNIDDPEAVLYWFDYKHRVDLDPNYTDDGQVDSGGGVKATGGWVGTNGFGVIAEDTSYATIKRSISIWAEVRIDDETVLKVPVDNSPIGNGNQNFFDQRAMNLYNECSQFNMQVNGDDGGLLSLQDFINGGHTLEDIG
jgi:hypothetical protein